MDHRDLFKTGGALDLMLGADPKADRNRREPAQGDLRLLVTMVGARPKAVLFRAVAPDASEGKGVLDQSPIGRVRFDEVPDVSDSVSLAGHDGDHEFPVPLAVLGLRPEPGAEVLGDLGILRGDGAQTTRRIDWNNFDTGLAGQRHPERGPAPAPELGHLGIPLNRSPSRTTSTLMKSRRPPSRR